MTTLSKDQLQSIIRCLNTSETIAEALDKVNEQFQLDLTKSKVEKLFKRENLSTPGKYLNREDNDDVKTICKFENTVLYMDSAGDYILEAPHFYGANPNGLLSLAYITKKLMEEVNVLYSSEGGKKTKQFIQQYLLDNYDIEFPLGLLEAYFKSLQQTHDAFPEAPHQVEEDPYDQVIKARQTRDRVRSKVRRQAIQDYEQKRIDQLKQLYEGMTNLLTRRHSITNYKAVPPEYNDYAQGHLVIPVGDLHVGAAHKMDLAQGLFIQYDLDVVKQRVNKICDYIQEELNAHMPDNVTLLFLGDYFEALLANMRKGQYLEMKGSPREHYDSLVSSMIQIIESASLYSDDVKINVILIGGNHDRLTEDKSYHSEELINHILADRLTAAFTGDNYKKINVMAGPPITSVPLNPTTQLVAYHGHLSSPRTPKDVDALLNLHGDRSKQRHVVIQGHLHSFSVQTGHNWRKYVAPSVIGNTRFNLEQLLLGSPAEFFMLRVFENHDQINGPYPL